MVTYNKFESFVGYLGLGYMNLHADVINGYLTNNAPSVSADTVYAELAQLGTGTGYTGPQDSTNTYTEATGTGSLVCQDWSVTSTGAALGPFQYVPHYDDSVTAPVVDVLVCWHDYGSAVTMATGESFTCDYGASLLTIS
jgi:hypothetical protein